MNTLQLTIRDKLAIITLDRGRSNPINTEMITELISSVKDIEANDNIAGSDGGIQLQRRAEQRFLDQFHVDANGFDKL
jgi:hypothetical protein